jgi:hypothetical protein
LEAIQDITNVFPLGEIHFPVSPVTYNLNPEYTLDGAQIVHFKPLLEFTLDALQSRGIITGNGQVINISRHNDLDSILSPNPHTVIRGTARESKIDEGGVQLLIPLPRTLLQPVE